VFGKRKTPAVETAVREEEVDKPAPISDADEDNNAEGNNSGASSVYSIEDLVNSGGIGKDEADDLFGDISSDDDESKGGCNSQESGKQLNVNNYY
jgi:hypothetical protein